MFDSATQGQPYPLPDNAVCFFHEEVQENKPWSEANGRPIYDRVIIVTIAARGQKSSNASYEVARYFPDHGEPDDNGGPPIVSMKVRENVLQRAGMREAFKAWESKQTLAASGTPLETWPAVNRAQVVSLKHVNVFTVEDLAKLPDGSLAHTGLGMQAREIRARAIAYLERAAGSADVERLAARIERLEQSDAAKDERIEELERENAALKARGAGETANPQEDEEDLPPIAPASERLVKPKGGEDPLTRAPPEPEQQTTKTPGGLNRPAGARGGGARATVAPPANGGLRRPGAQPAKQPGVGAQPRQGGRFTKREAPQKHELDDPTGDVEASLRSQAAEAEEDGDFV